MKLINKYLTLLLSVSLFTACDFMDCDESDYYSLDQIQESYSRVKQFVTNVYSYLPHDFCNLDGAMQDAATDDAVHVYENSNVQRFVNGTWSANYTVDDKYLHYYNGIHDANFYLENLTGLTFEDWKYNNDYDKWMQAYAWYEYEVRFLRAFFYFELVKRYQNVPLITRVMSVNEINNAEQASASDIFDFIISECTEIADKLPVAYNTTADAETGRITQGAALALKARVALYAASPLFNPSNDKEKWVRAAEAAYEIIGRSTELGYIQLAVFSNLFGATNNTIRKEVILARSTGTDNAFERSNFPMGIEGGRTSTCPSENLVSEFEMKDGTPFDWNNEEMRKNPYANRDPRLAMTVAYNGMKWPANKALEIWEGGANGLPLTNATPTGYYLCKYVNKSVSFASGQTPATPHHNWVLFRYGEVLLNYAEAMVNAYGDEGIEYTTDKCKMTALKAINDLRDRQGVKMPPLPNTLTSAEFLKKVKHERRVELAFEGHRFWDLRRWKELDSTKNIYGVKVTKEGSTVNYEKVLVTTNVVEDRMYFYPISNTERFKNKNLEQNPGW